MKIALLSDIHANRQALDACLQHARAQGAEQFALLGDLVGYGGEPVAVVEQVRDLAQQGALCVLGNHDAMALAPPANWAHSGHTTSSATATSPFCSRCRSRRGWAAAPCWCTPVPTCPRNGGMWKTPTRQSAA